MATDGEIDFSKYTREQLDSAVSRMDHERYPINSRNLIEEYQRRKAAEAAAEALAKATAMPRAPDRMLSAPKVFRIRYQPFTYLLNWLEPSRNDLRLTGSGTVQVDGPLIKLKGRRISYVAGIPFFRAEELGRAYVVNVEVQDRALRFELRVPGEQVRHVTLWLKSAEDASELAGMLPAERTQDFVPQLPEHVEFERLLNAQSPKAPVTHVLIGLCVIAYALCVLSTHRWWTFDGPSLIPLGSGFGPYTTDGDWFRVITSTFLHVGLVHLAFNMWALASFGPLVERLFGSLFYATIYLVTGIVSSLASVCWDPNVNSVGASGAIFGLFGALAAVQLHNDGSIPVNILRPLRRSSLIYIGCALLAGFGSGAIDNAAHVGGLLSGYLLGYLLRRPVTGLRLPIRVSLRRLGMTAIAAFLVLAAGVLIAKQAGTRLTNEGRYAATIHWFVPREAEAVNRWRVLAVAAKDNRWDGATFASRIESDIEPFWEEAQARWEKIDLPDTSAALDSLEFLQDLAADRLHAYGQLAQGLRTDDKKMLAAGYAGLEEADVRIRERKEAREAAKK